MAYVAVVLIVVGPLLFIGSYILRKRLKKRVVVILLGGLLSSVFGLLLALAMASNKRLPKTHPAQEDKSSISKI
ncbi:hypothetical protein QJS83_14265 [Bdellovibrio sp. 22V]|uniref:hypothetical protein n=1 Tax=Bdellovibrio sp. 22V TaxID=3044166 RepID=UPI0025427C83|nr:hypothetical protein [Bdellovibrio sp. 22V]WII71630.1 hypothetical protein QJS83_14265 [Bdellovibrio sp. 22V]